MVAPWRDRRYGTARVDGGSEVETNSFCIAGYKSRKKKIDYPMRMPANNNLAGQECCSRSVYTRPSACVILRRVLVPRLPETLSPTATEPIVLVYEGEEEHLPGSSRSALS